MRVKEVARKDIEERFQGMSDYVRIDYLSSCLKNNLDYDTRKFVLVKLAGLFESKGMYADAGKAMRAAAEINTTEKNKVEDFLKSIELFIRASDYEMADLIMRKMFPVLEVIEVKQIERRVKAMYDMHAKTCIQKGKRKQDIGAYEKSLTLNVEDSEKRDIRSTLLKLYEQVGDISQFNKMRRQIESGGQPNQF
jgi:tetratricopeptide (TPR) repeat protein